MKDHGYKDYVKSMDELHESVSKFNSYDAFLVQNNDTTLAESDFIRYKANHVLSEIEYWNASLNKESIRKKIVRKTMKKLKSNT